jgi:energy-coupling factor transport system ATP-binding protein
MKNCEVELNNISFKFKSGKKIFEDLDLCINKGQIIGIMGKSGAGKSTLLKLINGLIPKRIQGSIEGNILIKGNNIKEMSLSEVSLMVGTVFQNPDDQIVFPVVEDEIAFGLENLCYPKEYILEKIDNVLHMMGIKHLRDRNPNNLSGGEKQLVNIASILAMGVDIILLDESLSFLDNDGKDRVKNALSEIKTANKTIVMVDHDYENLNIADKIYLLDNKKLYEDKTNEW